MTNRYLDYFSVTISTGRKDFQFYSENCEVRLEGLVHMGKGRFRFQHDLRRDREIVVDMGCAVLCQMLIKYVDGLAEGASQIPGMDGLPNNDGAADVDMLRHTVRLCMEKLASHSGQH